MTRTDLCAAQDGPIEWRQTGVWDPGAWVHADDGTRFRNGHVAQPMPQCPKCGSPKYVFDQSDPWADVLRCNECGHVDRVSLGD